MTETHLQKSYKWVLQTNNLTLAEKDEKLSPLQENTIGRLCLMLKKYMTANKEDAFKIQKSVFSGPVQEFSLNYRDIDKTERKDRILEEVLALTKIQFWFPAIAWIGTSYETRYIARGPIFASVGINESSPDNLIIQLNPSIIPLLLYYGEGVGGTWYPLEKLLSDPSSNTKQFRKLLWSWKNFGRPIEMSIDKFKSLFNVKYCNRDLKRNVLEPCREYFEKEHMIWFEYEMTTSDTSLVMSKSKRGPKQYDTLTFHVFSNEKETSKVESVSYTIIACIRMLFEPGDCIKQGELYEKITADPKAASHIAEKFMFYNKKYKDGEIDWRQFACTMRKIVQNDCDIEVDIAEKD